MRLRRRNFWLLLILLVVIFGLVFTCYFYSLVPVSDKVNLQLIPQEAWPAYDDDLDLSSLQLALKRNLSYLKRLPGERQMVYGQKSVAVERIRAVQEELLVFLQQKPGQMELGQFLKGKFELLESVATDRWPWQKQDEPVLFTGYYVPTLQGALKPDNKYRYPLYRKPDDLVTVDLPKFDLKRRILRLWPWLDKLPFGPCLEDLRFPVLRGRLSKAGKVVPYYSRQEIDYNDKLKGKKLELLWVDNEIDRFFLQIQGSGLVRMENGASVMVGYSAANGQPYRSIGGWLIRQGLMLREDVSMPSIRAWIEAHPERTDEILKVNPSYVFFRKLANSDALGCYQAPITGGRSIATDRRVFPGGALALIATEKPIFSRTGEFLEWRKFQRLVLNQDTGGAIKGPQRVDIYCGADHTAELMAGVMKQSGRLFILMPK